MCVSMIYGCCLVRIWYGHVLEFSHLDFQGKYPFQASESIPADIRFLGTGQVHFELSAG